MLRKSTVAVFIDHQGKVRGGELFVYLWSTNSPDFNITSLSSRSSASFEDGGIKSSLVSQLSILAGGAVEAEKSGGLSSNSVSDPEEIDVDPSIDSTSVSSSHDSIIIKAEGHLQSF